MIKIDLNTVEQDQQDNETNSTSRCLQSQVRGNLKFEVAWIKEHSTKSWEWIQSWKKNLLEKKYPEPLV